MKNVKKDEAVDEAISFDELDQYAGGLATTQEFTTSRSLIEKMEEAKKRQKGGTNGQQEH